LRQKALPIVELGFLASGGDLPPAAPAAGWHAYQQTLAAAFNHMARGRPACTLPDLSSLDDRGGRATKNYL